MASAFGLARKLGIQAGQQAAGDIGDVLLGEEEKAGGMLKAGQEWAKSWLGGGGPGQIGEQAPYTTGVEGMGWLGQQLRGDITRGYGAPSIAELQTKALLGQAMAAQQAQAAGATGANRAFAQREAGRNMAQMQSEALRQGMIARMQEELQRRQYAQGLLGQTMGGMAGLGLQRELGLEGISADVFGTAYGRQRGPRTGGILGPILSATGTVGAALVPKIDFGGGGGEESV